MLSFYQPVSQSTNVSPSPLRAPGVTPALDPGKGREAPSQRWPIHLPFSSCTSSPPRQGQLGAKFPPGV